MTAGEVLAHYYVEAEYRVGDKAGKMSDKRFFFQHISNFRLQIYCIMVHNSSNIIYICCDESEYVIHIEPMVASD